jgi:hypothetical protein
MKDGTLTYQAETVNRLLSWLGGISAKLFAARKCGGGISFSLWRGAERKAIAAIMARPTSRLCRSSGFRASVRTSDALATSGALFSC